MVPTLFYPLVHRFFELVWVALTDARQAVREAGIVALRSCLHLISQREPRQRNDWLKRTYDEARQGLRGNNEAVHGSLLVINELVVNAPEFMSSRFREVGDVFKVCALLLVCSIVGDPRRGFGFVFV